MRVLVLTEYYPRAYDAVNGIWTHRQTLAARDAGAEVRVIVLHRPIPSLRAIRDRDRDAALNVVRQPPRSTLDGIGVQYVRYLSPPRPLAYTSWGAWAAPALKLALQRLRREFAFELIHAHYAIPAGDAGRRALPDLPLVVSVHGHDVHGPHAGAPNIRAALLHARLVLANSAGTARRCIDYGARKTSVVHLGADLPRTPGRRAAQPTLVTVAHLAARKRHEDVLRAVFLLRDRHPALRYVVIGDGPEREHLRVLANSLGIGDRVEFCGALPHQAAVAAAHSGWLFVMPSIDEAFGVAYAEAMAGGVPAIGCRGEDGPEELAAAGGGIALVPARDPQALAQRIDSLLGSPESLDAAGSQARETVRRHFTWEQCGQATLAAYREALKAA